VTLPLGSQRVGRYPIAVARPAPCDGGCPGQDGQPAGRCKLNCRPKPLSRKDHKARFRHPKPSHCEDRRALGAQGRSNLNKRRFKDGSNCSAQPPPPMADLPCRSEPLSRRDREARFRHHGTIFTRPPSESSRGASRSSDVAISNIIKLAEATDSHERHNVS